MSTPFAQSLSAQQAKFAAVGLTNRYSSDVKRVVDLCLTIFALPFVLPFVLILSALVSLDGKSAFYTQERIGRNGKRFRILKLRTMVAGADAMLAAHLKADDRAAAEWQATQKLVDDPRITFVGRYLRKFSFDELPQLWNVLKGDMSLVGPRPMMPEQRHMYSGTAYFNMRPGLTGNWQVSQRNAGRFADRVEYDNAYAANLAFGLDVKLMLATVLVVFKGTGH